jgi:hypothetical protein
MKIKYFGHAAFELALASGANIVIDPYTAGAFGTLKYAAIEGNFDVAVVSHNHEDHVSREVLSHCMKIVNKSGKVAIGDVTIESLMTYHDSAKVPSFRSPRLEKQARDDIAILVKNLLVCRYSLTLPIIELLERCPHEQRQSATGVFSEMPPPPCASGQKAGPRVS